MRLSNGVLPRSAAENPRNMALGTKLQTWFSRVNLANWDFSAGFLAARRGGHDATDTLTRMSFSSGTAICFLTLPPTYFTLIPKR